jgi:hypothetical protein
MCGERIAGCAAGRGAAPRGEFRLPGRAGGQIRANAPQSMEAVTPTDRRLAGAFLALADDPAPPLSQRSVPRVVTALAATVTLALAAPVAWVATAPGKLPADPPAATATAKAALAGPHADDDDGAS